MAFINKTICPSSLNESIEQTIAAWGRCPSTADSSMKGNVSKWMLQKLLEEWQSADFMTRS